MGTLLLLIRYVTLLGSMTHWCLLMKLMLRVFLGRQEGTYKSSTTMGVSHFPSRVTEHPDSRADVMKTATSTNCSNQYFKITCSIDSNLLDLTTPTVLGKAHKLYSSSDCNFLHLTDISSFSDPSTLLSTLFSNKQYIFGHSSTLFITFFNFIIFLIY